MRPQEQHRDGDHRKVFTAKATRVVAIGASMGGVEALEQILSQYPEDCPATLIVQHIPETMGQAFAQRLDKACKAQVCVAENGMILRRGLVLVAPGGMHMVLRSKANQFYVLVKDGPRFNYHKPSVDVLFRSVARNAGKSAVGVLLTGMGSDGASGLKLMRDSGAATRAPRSTCCPCKASPAKSRPCARKNSAPPAPCPWTWCATSPFRESPTAPSNPCGWAALCSRSITEAKSTCSSTETTRVSRKSFSGTPRSHAPAHPGPQPAQRPFFMGETPSECPMQHKGIRDSG